MDPSTSLCEIYNLNLHVKLGKAYGSKAFFMALYPAPVLIDPNE